MLPGNVLVRGALIAVDVDGNVRIAFYPLQIGFACPEAYDKQVTSQNQHARAADDEVISANGACWGHSARPISRSSSRSTRQ
jgi:hypothetical protein